MRWRRTPPHPEIANVDFDYTYLDTRDAGGAPVFPGAKLAGAGWLLAGVTYLAWRTRWFRRPMTAASS